MTYIDDARALRSEARRSDSFAENLRRMATELEREAERSRRDAKALLASGSRFRVGEIVQIQSPPTVPSLHSYYRRYPYIGQIVRIVNEDKIAVVPLADMESWARFNSNDPQPNRRGWGNPYEHTEFTAWCRRGPHL